MKGHPEIRIRTRVQAHCALIAAAAVLLTTTDALAQGGTVSEPSAGPPAIAAGGPARDVADSATLARARYRIARELLARGDTASALKELLSAATAFPAQPVYAAALWAVASLAQDAAMAREALGIANDNGIALLMTARSRALVPDTGLFSAMYVGQASLTREINAGTAFRALSDARLFPESVAHDARTGTLYVTSLQHRGVLAIAREGSERWLLSNPSHDVGGLYGIAIDTLRNTLWVSSAQSPATKSWNVADSTLSALLEIDLHSGLIRNRHVLRGTALSPNPGDVALARNGDVFVSDGQAGVVWWFKRGEGSARTLQHKLYRSPQGMVASDDGRFLWIADYAHGLLRTELATGATVRVSALRGFSTVGIDGLLRHGNTFVAVQNATAPGQVLRFELDAAGLRMISASVVDRNTIAVSPTGGTMVGDDYVYISNTLWDKVGADGLLPADASRVPVLLRVPMRLR